VVAPEERLGDTAEIAKRFGPASSRRQVLVLDAPPERPGALRATLTVPQVPSGRYGLDVCLNERQCFLLWALPRHRVGLRGVGTGGARRGELAEGYGIEYRPRRRRVVPGYCNSRRRGGAGACAWVRGAGATEDRSR
jgi:hypothetical protein